MMEAVVTKMSRIIAHVGSGEKGSHVLQKLQVCFYESHCLLMCCMGSFSWCCLSKFALQVTAM